MVVHKKDFYSQISANIAAYAGKSFTLKRTQLSDSIVSKHVPNIGNVALMELKFV